VKPVTDGDLFRALLADPDRSSGLASQTR
jgi:hypothetical protein